MAEVEPTFADGLEISGQEFRTGYQALQAGVIGSGDLKVTAGGAVRTVDVAAGTCLIAGSTIPDQGLYRARNDASKNSANFELGGIAAAGANPRLDQIIARMYDPSAIGGPTRKWRLEVLGGTATSGATLSNRTGAAALPADSLRIADVLIPTSGVITSAEIRDRRPWARGYLNTQNRSGAGLVISIPSNTTQAIDSTNLSQRVECSGVPVRLKLTASISSGTGGIGNRLFFQMDGATLASSLLKRFAATTDLEMVCHTFLFTPAAGSHLLVPFGTAESGSAMNFSADSGINQAIQFSVEELVRQNANNGTS